MRRFITTVGLALLLGGIAAPIRADWNAGVAAFQAGDYATAAQEFQALVDATPGVWQNHYMLGQAQLKLGQPQAALESLRQAYDLNPDQLAVQVLLANAYMQNGRYREAGALLQQMDASALPASKRATYNQMLAKAMAETGNASAALAPLRSAAEDNSDSAEAWYDYGVMAFNLGQTDTAVSALSRAVGLSGATAAMREAYVQALFRQGRTSSGSSKRNAYSKAVPVAETLVRSEASADHYILLGEAALGAEQYSTAIEAFRQAAAKSPSWLPYYYMGQAYMQQKQYDSAASILQQGLQRASSAEDQGRIWSLLGLVYEKAGEYEQAKQAYLQAGDSSAAQRVQENLEIAQYNEGVEAENERIREMEAERERIREELKDLPGGGADEESGDDG